MSGQFIRGVRPQGSYGHNQRPFGVYRPLTPDCAMAVNEAAYWATEEASEYLRRRGKKREGFNMLGHMGVTFVARKDVQRSFRYNTPSMPLDEARAAALFADIVPSVSDTDVPIDRVDWFSPQDRRIGVRLHYQAARKELGSIADYVGLWLQEIVKIGGPEPTVLRRPNHTTFGMYGLPSGREALSAVEKTEIGTIFKGHLDDEGVTSITLGQWVVGEDYTVSYPEYGHPNSPLVRAA